jgi:hypothetical protein
MSFTDHYRKKLSREGSNEADAIFNHTMDIANQQFMNAPNAKVALVNGEEVDVRILEGKTSQERFMLLRPKSKIDIGSVLEIDDERWLAFDLLGEDISPKVYVQSCNDYLRWKDANGTVQEVTARASATRNTKYDIQSDKMQVELLIGGIYAYVSANEITRTIAPSQRFILGGSVYEIAGVDDVSNVDQYGKGVLQLTCKLTTKGATDNFTTRIADNSQLYKSISNTENSGGGAGDLW